MSSISVSEARYDMKDILNRVAYGKERIFLTSHHKKLVAIVPLEDIELLQRLEDEDDIRIAEKRLLKAEKEGTYTHEEMMARLGVDV